MSQWTLSTEQFGQQFEFSWLARDLEPIQYEKARNTSTLLHANKKQ